MFMTKKKFNEAVAERQKAWEESMAERDWHENERRYTAERFERLERKIAELEMQVCELKGIKDRYDAVCEVTRR